ncbi:M20 family metallopeptidase [Chloroflexus sp.]|uniref:M20 family metallopeptidase n=1 Tax=Chloroflexus sp. TaxID=1904827 RepID=UPI00298EE0DA|nr:M20 family metallopeptidase [Chloroflexus sp.]MCS6888036.1 M20 family metallopeptidase [Chloroflexus sp.]MDW8404684.1 M20 family metallopeptidase [Chloroflexus sp.]
MLDRTTIAVHEAAMLDLIARLVHFESPSTDKALLDACADELAALFARVGKVERIANPAGGDHLRVTVMNVAEPTLPPALVLCHYDTVWPAGTVAQRPFTVTVDRAFGPGAYDMKASIAMVYAALGGFGQPAPKLRRPVIVLLTSDEEIGSPTSRALIEATAAQAAHVLVIEPPTEPDGALKTARKGGGAFRVTITGRAAHAGVEPEKGASAITELAHQILAVNALANPALGTTVNVGVVGGGTRPNVVPAEAWMDVDVRVWTQAEAARIEAGMAALQPVTPGTQVAVSGNVRRPPMEYTPASAALFARAKELGAALGLDIREGSTGGGSDGNFTAALGIPTLDGLGCPGAGAHADHEQISRQGLIDRTALLCALLSEI